MGTTGALPTRGAARRVPGLRSCSFGWVAFVLLVLAAFGGWAGDASAAVTYRASNSASGTAQDFSCLGPNATANVTKPAGTVSGDMMIATVAASGNGSETVPTGWTLLAQNTAGQSQKVYYKLAGGSEPASYSWTSAGFCAGQSAIAVVIDTYAGVDPTQPFTTGAGTAYTSTAALVMPGDTALEAGSMRISSAGGYRNNSTLTTTSWSALTPASSKNVVYGSVSLNVASAYEAQGVGATTSATATQSQSVSNGLAYTVVLRPKHSQKLGFSTQPVGGVAEGTDFGTQPAVAIQFGDGTTNTADTSDVTLAKASGPVAGVLSCSGGLTVTAVSGVASFSGCQITGTQAAGTYTLTATSTGLTGATSASFTITVGAAAKLAFTTQPVGNVNENVNWATQPAVTVRDAYDNNVTSDTGNVTLSIASGPGSGSITGCTANPKAAVSGVATFASCKITGTAAAGTYTLSAGRAGLTSGTSASFTITAGAASKVGFVTNPGDSTEGVALSAQPAVAIQDSFGNTVTGNTSTVTLAIASGPGSGALSCTGGLSKAAVSGVATFVGCQITGTAAAGTYTLSAADGALTGATSLSFVISAGAAAKLAFTTQPVGGVAEATNLPTQPTVTVQDAYGNTVPGDTSAVTLAIATGPGSGILTCTANPRSATAGVATFAGCQITGTAAAGTYTLAASDGALTGATSASFTIVPGAATKLAFTTQPVGGVTPGIVLPTQPAVAIRDAYDNVATSNTSTVTLAIASGPGGTLTCNATSVAATAGTVTFAGCKINTTPGTYTLVATDGALTSATSASFVIDVGSLSFSTSDYSFPTVSLNGYDQAPTATLALHVADTTGAGAGWRITAAASGWTGGTGTLSAAQRITTPPAPTCDGGAGTCTPASTGSVGWPLSLTATPTVIYNATSGTGLNPQTVNLPITLPIPGGVIAGGTFTQDVALSITSGP